MADFSGLWAHRQPRQPTVCQEVCTFSCFLSWEVRTCEISPRALRLGGGALKCSLNASDLPRLNSHQWGPLAALLAGLGLLSPFHCLSEVSLGVFTFLLCCTIPALSRYGSIHLGYSNLHLCLCCSCVPGTPQSHLLEAEV